MFASYQSALPFTSSHIYIGRDYAISVQCRECFVFSPFDIIEVEEIFYVASKSDRFHNEQGDTHPLEEVKEPEDEQDEENEEDEDGEYVQSTAEAPGRFLPYYRLPMPVELYNPHEEEELMAEDVLYEQPTWFGPYFENYSTDPPETQSDQKPRFSEDDSTY
ncbi:unnamed protein product [Echinostoma caproni]|uniref:Iwr1 domain-containing protein n=1 Tax=Echinostoma caproni TaxID=27848 RepID=A0A183AKT9_9TREM|nr:unnamed protein product [Echinostoma caproni]